MALHQDIQIVIEQTQDSRWARLSVQLATSYCQVEKDASMADQGSQQYSSESGTGESADSAPSVPVLCRPARTICRHISGNVRQEKSISDTYNKKITTNNGPLCPSHSICLAKLYNECGRSFLNLLLKLFLNHVRNRRQQSPQNGQVQCYITILLPAPCDTSKRRRRRHTQSEA